LIKILVGVSLQQRNFGAISCRFRVKITSSTHMSQARWIVFGSSRLGEEVLQDDFSLCLDLV